MYFKNITENIGQVPQYFVDDILENKNDIILDVGYRSFIGLGNKICQYGKMSFLLRKTTDSLGAYILSQQFPLLKNMVIVESVIVAPGSPAASIKMPTRYLNRVGELFIVPLSGSGKVKCHEFAESGNLSIGKITRINNRVNSEWTLSDNFIACAFTFLDFDLNKYLMPFDLNSPFVRRKDEFLNPELAPQQEVQDNAY